MDEKHLKIELVWGSDKIWTAKVEDVPGLEFEAESIDGLINALKETLPEITLLTRTSVDSITSKNDTRQKYKSASIIQEAVQAKESNNVNRFHELCARVGESRATEEVLRQFLGRF